MWKVRNIPSTQMSALQCLPLSVTTDKENLCSDLSQNRFVYINGIIYALLCLASFRHIMSMFLLFLHLYEPSQVLFLSIHSRNTGIPPIYFLSLTYTP